MPGRPKQGLEWFRLDAGFPEHPKVLHLARDLKVPLLTARGLLVTLWCWTARYFPTGVLKGVSDQEIATAAGYRGRKPFADLLRRRGLLDKSRGAMRVHGWADRQGADLRQRQAERDRKRRARAKAREERALSQDRPPDNPGTPGRTVPGTSAGHPPDVGGTGPTGPTGPTGSKPEPRGEDHSEAKARERKAHLARLFDQKGFPKTAKARRALLPGIAAILADGRTVTLEDEQRWTGTLQKALKKDRPVGWAVDVLADPRWSQADEDRQPARAEVLDDQGDRSEDTTSLGKEVQEVAGQGPKGGRS